MLTTEGSEEKTLSDCGSSGKCAIVPMVVCPDLYTGALEAPKLFAAMSWSFAGAACACAGKWVVRCPWESDAGEMTEALIVEFSCVGGCGKRVGSPKDKMETSGSAFSSDRSQCVLTNLHGDWLPGNNEISGLECTPW